MPPMIVQIYEIQTPAEAKAVIALGADHIGSVLLSDKDWKIQAIRETVAVTARMGAKSSLIPLFSDPDAVCRCLDYYAPDIVHFCENPGTRAKDCIPLIRLQETVKMRFPAIRIMRSIPIPETGLADTAAILEIARIFEPVSDLFLTDTVLSAASGQTEKAEQAQPVAGFVGITGRTCDWDAARKLVEASAIPVILAGGLTPENVAKGIAATRPAGVDSCTGTNRRDNNGRPIRFAKDLDRVKTFVELAQKASENII